MLDNINTLLDIIDEYRLTTSGEFVDKYKCKNCDNIYNIFVGSGISLLLVNASGLKYVCPVCLSCDKIKININNNDQ